MPRKLANPFASYASMTAPEKKGQRKPSQAKGNRLTQLFSGSPRPKDAPSAQQSLLAMQQQQATAGNPSPQITAPSLSLPTISLSTAMAGEPNTDELPTTLFQPPSDAEARRQRRFDAQFGPLLDPSHRYVSKHPGGTLDPPVCDEPPYYYVLTTYISYLILIAFGHARDFFGKRFGAKKTYATLKAANGFAPLHDDFDNFYVRRLKKRIDDCFARPTTGVPGRYITLIDRRSDDYNATYQFTGTYTETLNMSSYNYLGFAQSEGPCADAVEECVRKSTASRTR